MSRRTERVASLIRELVAEAIRDEITDPRFEQMTTVTRVEMSPDLSVAKVFVSVMARQSRRELSLTVLQHAAGMLRSAIAPHVSMRMVPRLVFELDETLRRELETADAIDRAMQRTAASEAARAQRPPDDRGDAKDDSTGDANAALRRKDS